MTDVQVLDRFDICVKPYFSEALKEVLKKEMMLKLEHGLKYRIPLEQRYSLLAQEVNVATQVQMLQQQNAGALQKANLRYPRNPLRMSGYRSPTPPRYPPPRYVRGVSEEEENVGEEGSDPEGDGRSGVCYQCKQPGHWMQDCPQLKQKGQNQVECFRCHKFGHYAAECRMKLSDIPEFRQQRSPLRKSQFVRSPHHRSESSSGSGSGSGSDRYQNSRSSGKSHFSRKISEVIDKKKEKAVPGHHKNSEAQHDKKPRKLSPKRQSRSRVKLHEVSDSDHSEEVEEETSEEQESVSLTPSPHRQ